MKHTGPAFAIIEDLANDTETPIGTRLESLRHLAAAIAKAQTKLHLQLGMDMAKQLTGLGIQRSGRPAGDALKVRDWEAERG